MTISNHSSGHANGAKQNGERQPPTGNDPAAKTNKGHPPTANGTPDKPKAESKGGEKAPKQAAAKKGVKETAAKSPSPEHRVLGYRVFDETEEHFPCGSLVLPDVPHLKRWLDWITQLPKHEECAWRAEKLYVGFDSHLYSTWGSLDADDPVRKPIEWDPSEPYDLGPLDLQIPPERSGEKGGAGFLEAIGLLQAQPEVKSEPPVTPPRSEPKPSSIGESQPAPKSTSPKKGVRSKSAPPARRTPLVLRTKAAKHTRRAKV